jgi:hypothetical protein
MTRWAKVYFFLIITNTLCIQCLYGKESRRREGIHHGDINAAIPNNPVEVHSRAHRFPTVEQRIQLYMSNWYTPPCAGNVNGTFEYSYVSGSSSSWSFLIIHDASSVNGTLNPLQFESIIQPDKTFFLDRSTLTDCIASKPKAKYASRILFRENMGMYCRDVVDSLLTDHILWENPQFASVPILIQFGDLKHSHEYRDLNVPHFKKFRSASTAAMTLMAPSDCVQGSRPSLSTVHSNVKLQPIVWKLATSRHFRLAHQVYKEDTPWEKKQRQAVFRGQLTGSPEGYNPQQSDMDNCWQMRRCRLVYQHSNSSLVDARLTSTRGRLPEAIHGVPLVAPKVMMRTLLQYKAIIMLEGNDVASGLKWALLSQSVVLMPPPRHTSWLMEELLQPWVHYIPLQPDLTNVETQMQWINDHDDQARRIAQRGSLWMEDLCYHPDALEDDRYIQEEMIRRYMAHFRPAVTDK